MEIRQLRYFLAVYQYGNISKAAQELYITQQTLSKQLREFETELGVPLFIRRVKGVEPTEYAKSLLSPAKQIVRAMDNAQRMLDEMRKQEPMTVRIGLVRGDYHDGSPLSPRELFEWERQFPQIAFEVREYDPPTLDRMLVQEELELACTLNGAEEPELIKVLISVQPAYILVSGENPIAKKSGITAEDLRGQVFLEPKVYAPPEILPVPQGEDNPAPDKANLLACLHFRPQFHMFNGTFDQGVERVRANEGILLSSRSYCLAQNLDGLAALPLPFPQMEFRHYLAYKKGRRLPEPVWQFIKKHQKGRSPERGEAF